MQISLARRLKKSKRKSIRQIYEEVLENSDCKIDIDITARLVKVTFTGLMARFPSISNSSTIRFNKSTKRLFKSKSDPQIARLKAATHLYSRELYRLGICPPSYQSEEVFVRIYTPTLKTKKNKVRKYDSHNYIKGIADWLEDVGMYDDDTQADIHASRASDMGDDSTDTLSIFILPLKHVRESLRRVDELHFRKKR